MAAYHLPAQIRPGDLEVIAAPLDFLGVNHYHDDAVSGHPQPGPGGRRPTTKATSSPIVGSEFVTFPGRSLPRTAMDWEVNPDGLEQLLVRLGRDYPTLPPLYVTENGAAYADEVSADGQVHDPERVAFLERTSPRWRGPARPAPTYAASSPGRCSTTSSGPGGTPSASA